MEKSARNIAKAGREKALSIINENQAYFNYDVAKGFKIIQGKGTTTHVSAKLVNEAQHAGALDEGVPASSYADGGPPVQALLPWVARKMRGWTFGDGSDSNVGGSSIDRSGESDSGNDGGISNYSDSVTESLATKKSNRIMDSLGYEDSDNTRLDRTYLDSPTKSVWNYNWKNSWDSDSDEVSENEFITDVEWVSDKLKSWKSKSSPGKDNVQYSKSLSETFDIYARVRGEDEYELFDVPDSRKQRLAEFQKMSQRYILDNFDDDDDGFVTLYRSPQNTEVSLISKEIWENPRDESWQINLNAVMNYSVRDKILSMFDRGMEHRRSTNVEKDVLTYPDAFIDGDHSSEGEVHIRGDRAVFDRDDLTFSDWNGERSESELLSSAEFYDAQFDSMTDNEIDGLRFMIRKMARKDVVVETTQAKQRLTAWVNEFVDRGFALDNENTWKRRVNEITDGYYSENGG
jgi:hypothetical protein